MRRYLGQFVLLSFLSFTAAASAGEGKVCKVLAQFLDQKGRQSLSPSLYERDAYQFFLRKHLKERSALRLTVQWKAKNVDWTKMKLRAEIRGLRNEALQTVTLEKPAAKNGYFTTWSDFELSGDKFKKFGELVAWRVTLWEGDRQLGKQESFLWSGVGPSAQ